MGDLVAGKHRKLHFKTDEGSENGHVQHAIATDEQDDSQDPEPNRCGNGRESPSSNKTDGLQQLLQIAEEYESTGLLKTRHQHDGPNHDNGDVDYGSLPKSGLKEGPSQKVDDQRLGVEVSHSEQEAHSYKSLQLKDVAPSPPSESPQFFSRGAPRRSHDAKEVPDTGQGPASSEKRRSSGSSPSSITVGRSWSNCTIPQPFSLATDRRVSESSPRVQQLNGRPDIAKKAGTKLDKPKLMCSDGIKHSEGSLKKLTICSDPESQDEDTMPISSTPSGSQAPKAKASRFTNSSGFKFQCEARAEKRKEYYLKLQERLNAKEEEIRQMQASAKKEREEEIKQLRRSLMYKASPIPSFYQEGPPPKVELPKIPATRAKSPNFSRRDSTGSNRLCNILRCEGEHRHSLSPMNCGKHKDLSVVLSGSSEHGSVVGGSPLSESAAEDTLTRGNAFEVFHDGIHILGFNTENMEVVKVREPLSISSELMNQVTHVAQLAENEHMTGNGGEADTICKPTRATTTTDTFQKPGQVSIGSNVLRRHNGEMYPSSLSGHKVQVVTAQGHPDGDDDPVTAGHKKQRRKALTPYFRKQILRDSAESTGNEDAADLE